MTHHSKDSYTIKNIGITYSDLARGGNGRIKLTPAIISKVLDMSIEELREFYIFLGLTGDFALTLEGLHCALFWLYLADRIRFFGFDAKCRAPYKVRRHSKNWESRCSTEITDEEYQGMMQRFLQFTGAGKEYAWAFKYVIDTIVNSYKQDKILAIKQVLFNTSNKPWREDYAVINDKINAMDLRDRRNMKIRMPAKTFYNMMDIIRITAFHGYSGIPLDFRDAIRGNRFFIKKVEDGICPEMKKYCVLPSIKTLKDEFPRLFLKALCLESA